MRWVELRDREEVDTREIEIEIEMELAWGIYVDLSLFW